MTKNSKKYQPTSTQNVDFHLIFSLETFKLHFKILFGQNKDNSLKSIQSNENPGGNSKSQDNLLL